MKCDELKDYDYDPDFPFQSRGRFYVADEVEAAIDELKAAHHKERHEYIKMIAELKQKLEEAKATAYAESVDAGMENRRLKRALWVTRTAMAKSEKDRWNAHIDCGNKRNRKDPAYVKTGKLLEVSEWRRLWADIERKCLKKAEEYK